MKSFYHINISCSNAELEFLKRLSNTNGEVVVALHGLDDWYTTVVREQIVPRLFSLLCPSTSHAAQHAVRTTSRRGPRHGARSVRARSSLHGRATHCSAHGPRLRYGVRAAPQNAWPKCQMLRGRYGGRRPNVRRRSPKERSASARCCAPKSGLRRARARRVGSCGRKDAAGPRALAPAGTVRRARASIGEGAGG